MNYKKITFCFFFIYFAIFYSYGFQIDSPVKVKYKGIDRTLFLLQSSSIENPQTLNMLFYGQSIIGGIQPQKLIDSIKQAFPYTNISYKHKPIGGFTVPSLIKTAEHDVYHENPDLIIFHAYDGIKDGLLDSLIRRVRMKMPSDILLLNHHYVWNTSKNNLETITKSHDFDSEVIKQIAQKYDCGFLNVRDRWRKHLERNKIKANKLIGNTVASNLHPNAKGNRLLRQLILSKLKSQPKSEYKLEKDKHRSIVSFNRESNKIKACFFGNRLELFMGSQEQKKPTVIEVLIDNKKPSSFHESFYITRPSKGYLSHMPALKKVSLGHPLPIEEDWEITITQFDRTNNTFKFKIYGSRTGFDGTGSSAETFTSNSKRIKIEKEDFNIFNIEKIVKQHTPSNFKINFSVKAIVKDKIVIPHYTSKCVLFNNGFSKKHTLELKIIKGDRKIKKIISFSPYLENDESKI